METINGLLRALDNKVPASIAKRLEGLKKLNEKLVSARNEHNQNPTEESEEALEEIVEFLKDTQEDLLDDLSALVEQKNAERENLEARARKEESEAKARKEASLLKTRREASERRAIEERTKLELEKKQLEEKELEEKALESGGKTETEKKSGFGWGGLLLGGLALVLTGGAIKFFGNKR